MTGFFHSGPEPYSHYLQNEQKYVSMRLQTHSPKFILVATGATPSPCKMESAVQIVLTVWIVPMRRSSYLGNVHWDISSMLLAL
jgi:hypothetical protein